MGEYVSWGQFLIAIAVAIGLWWLSSRQLVTETKKLRHLNEMILKALQNNDMADLRLDKNGEIVGLNITIGAHGSPSIPAITASGGAIVSSDE